LIAVDKDVFRQFRRFSEFSLPVASTCSLHR
jgi:hypothetical protein